VAILVSILDTLSARARAVIGAKPASRPGATTDAKPVARADVSGARGVQDRVARPATRVERESHATRRPAVSGSSAVEPAEPKLERSMG
jgi:hypothetical protein